MWINRQIVRTIFVNVKFCDFSAKCGKITLFVIHSIKAGVSESYKIILSSSGLLNVALTRHNLIMTLITGRTVQVKFHRNKKNVWTTSVLTVK